MFRILFIIILSIVVVLLSLLIVANNQQTAELNFLLSSIQLSVASLVVLCFTAGFIVALILISISYLTLKIKYRLLQNNFNKAKAQNKKYELMQQQINITDNKSANKEDNHISSSPTNFFTIPKT